MVGEPGPEENAILDFLKSDNMNSNPEKWKEGYKKFIEKTGSELSFESFKDHLLNLLNYYFLISMDYDFNEEKYKDFFIRS